MLWLLTSVSLNNLRQYDKWKNAVDKHTPDDSPSENKDADKTLVNLSNINQNLNHDLCVLKFKSLVLLKGGPTCGRSLTEVGMTEVMHQPPKIVGPAAGLPSVALV